MKANLTRSHFSLFSSSFLAMACLFPLHLVAQSSTTSPKLITSPIEPTNTNAYPPPPVTEIAPELQEPGVFYIHNQLPAPVQGKVEAITTLYSHRTFLTAVATLVPGQVVEIIAIANEGFLVRPLTRGDSAIGWIRKDQLPESVDKGLLAQAEKLYQHQQEIDVAIANKNVIQGMTENDVQAAIGKPQQFFKQTLPQGTYETWTYTTYKQVPQNSYSLDGSGNAVPQTSYVSVPIGSLTVNFDNGLVNTVQEVRTDPESPGVYQQPPPPATADYSAPQYSNPAPPADQSAYVSPPVTYYQGPTYYPVWGGYGYRGAGRVYNNNNPDPYRRSAPVVNGAPGNTLIQPHR